MEMKTNSCHAEQWLKDGVKNVYDYITRDLKPEDMVSITLSSGVLQNEVHLLYIPAHNLIFDHVWSLLPTLFQKNTEGREGDILKLIVTRGLGQQPPGFQNIMETEQSTSETANVELANEEQRAAVEPTTGMTECNKCMKQYLNTEDRGCCDKCYIKDGRCKKQYIPYSQHSWDSYEDFKKWQNTYDRQKVKCDICDKEMIRTSIYRHKARYH